MDGEVSGMCRSVSVGANHLQYSPSAKEACGGVSNFLTEKSKSHKKVYVSKVFNVPDSFHYKYMITVLLFILEV